MSGRGMRSPQP